MIELTSARLRRDIGDLTEQADDVPTASQPDRPARKAPTDPNWRLKLLDAAWGADSPPISSDAMQSLAAGLPADVTIDRAGLDANSIFPHPVGRIVLNLLLLAAESLPMGGIVRLAGSADDLFLQISGSRAGWPGGMALCAVDQAAAVAAISDAATTGIGSVQMPLTTLLAHASGVRLSLLFSSSSRSEPPILRLGGR